MLEQLVNNVMEEEDHNFTPMGIRLKTNENSHVWSCYFEDRILYRIETICFGYSHWLQSCNSHSQ